jgi:hypothetical protein
VCVVVLRLGVNSREYAPAIDVSVAHLHSIYAILNLSDEVEVAMDWSIIYRSVDLVTWKVG